MSIRSFATALRKYTFTKGEILLFFVASFFIVFGLLSFTQIFLEKLWPLNSLLKQENSQTNIYPFNTIAIDTPFAAALTVNEPIFPDRICSIIDYGAIPDGKTMNTEAFRRAIDACANLGGGKVNVPGGIWLTGAIHLRNNINLHIDREATVLFSTNTADYLPVVFSRFEGIEYYNYSALIYTADATNVAITGLGTLDGRGPVAWWKMTKIATKTINSLYAMGDDNTPLSERVFGTEQAGLRPAFIECVRCSNVLIEDITIKDGPMWTIHPLYSNNVIIRDVNIATAPGPSTDGIVIDSSSNVLIEDTSITSGDDAIAIKSGRDKEGMRLHIPSENIVIRNCAIKDSHSGVAIGSEISGDIRNVFINNIDVATAQYGFRIKATRGRGGIVENVWVERIRMDKVSIEAIQMTTSYGLPFREDSTLPPIFRNISLKEITAKKAPRSIHITGLPEQPITGISLENISLAAKRGIEFSETNDVNLNNVQVTTMNTDEPLFTLMSSAHINIAGSNCPSNIHVCLSLFGEKTQDINIQKTDFQREKIKVSEEVSQDALIQ